MERSSIGRTTSDQSVHSIVRAVAEREGVKSTSLPPLYDVLDPDALTALVDRSGNNISVEFTYCDYRVTVDSDGEVSVADEQDSSRHTVGCGEL